MTTRRKNKHLRSSFDAYLVEEGLYEEATSVAWKRVLVEGVGFEPTEESLPRQFSRLVP